MTDDDDECIEWCEYGLRLDETGAATTSDAVWVGMSPGLRRLQRSDPALFDDVFLKGDLAELKGSESDASMLWPPSFRGCIVLRSRNELRQNMGRGLVLSLHERTTESTGRGYPRHVWFVLPERWSDTPCPVKIGAACERLLRYRGRADPDKEVIVGPELDFSGAQSLFPPALETVEEHVRPMTPATPSELMMAMLERIRDEVDGLSWRSTLAGGITVLCSPGAARGFALAMPATPLAVREDWRRPGSARWPPHSRVLPERIPAEDRPPMPKPSRPVGPVSKRGASVPRSRHGEYEEQVRVRGAVSPYADDEKYPGTLSSVPGYAKYKESDEALGPVSPTKGMLGLLLAMGLAQTLLLGIQLSRTDGGDAHEDAKVVAEDDAPLEVVPEISEVPRPNVANEARQASKSRLAPLVLDPRKLSVLVLPGTGVADAMISKAEQDLMDEVAPGREPVAVVGFASNARCDVADRNAQIYAEEARAMIERTGHEVREVIIVGRRGSMPRPLPPQAPLMDGSIGARQDEVEMWREQASRPCVDDAQGDVGR